VSNFANYNATYGSLGAIIVSLTWLWLSAYAFVLGAELDSRIAATVYGVRTADAPTAPPPISDEADAKASSPVKGTLLTAVGLGMLATGRTREHPASAKVTRAPRAR
jgi:membrane protein